MIRMERNAYFKQVKLYNPAEHNPKVYVYGAGSIGSHVVVGLAKVGIKDITVFDFDKVEWDNIPAQFYDLESTELKVHELVEIVKRFTGIGIRGSPVKIDKYFKAGLEHKSIHILAFDNIEARKIIIDKLEGFPVHIIDGRIGGFNWEKYYINCQEDMTAYKKTLEGSFAEMECGEKCLWIVNSMIASKIIADVIKIYQNKKPAYMVKGSAISDILICKGVQDGKV